MQNNFNPQYIKSANIKLDRDLEIAKSKLITEENKKTQTKENLTTWVRVKRYFKRYFG